MKNRLSKIVLILTLIFINIGCDQATKHLAWENLKNEPEISYCDRVFVLTYAENPGAFYGSGSNLEEPFKSLLLIAIPSLALAFLLFYTFKTSFTEALAFCFIIGGGFSNVYDRIAYGKVIDFLNVGVGDFRTGIFNVADMAIMFGMCILLFIYLKKN